MHGMGHAWPAVCMVGSVCAGDTATEAGGRHPTGIHSCQKIFHTVIWRFNQKSNCCQHGLDNKETPILKKMNHRWIFLMYTGNGITPVITKSVYK